MDILAKNGLKILASATLATWLLGCASTGNFPAKPGAGPLEDQGSDLK